MSGPSPKNTDVRAKRVKAERARVAGRLCMSNQRANRYHLHIRYVPRAFRAAYEDAVDSLSNHERHKWARAGYPGAKDHDPEKVRAFDASFQVHLILAERRA